MSSDIDDNSDVIEGVEIDAIYRWTCPRCRTPIIRASKPLVRTAAKSHRELVHEPQPWEVPLPLDDPKGLIAAALNDVRNDST